MIIENVSIEEIKKYSKNAKLHTKKQIDGVSESIKQFGFIQPLVIDRNNEVIIGHCRLEAAMNLKLKVVPCVRCEDLTEEQVKALRIADNKLNESKWDDVLLKSELDTLSLANFDMSSFGFEEIEKEVVEVEIPEISKSETICKFGDIWQLGKHRLLCGDSTKEEDVNRLMNGKMADMVLTDPPYNVNIKNRAGLQIENDNMDSERFYEFLFLAFNNIFRFLKNGGGFYVWYASCEHINFEKALVANGLIVHQVLIWNKSQIVLGRSDYQNKFEPCLYGWKNGQKHYFIDSRKQKTVLDYENDKMSFEKMKKDELIRFIENLLFDNISTDVIDELKPNRSREHPTMKPIRLMSQLILNSSQKNEIVLDLFGGSGTTLLACEQLERSCRMIEYDPHYCDVIIKRWEDFTGEKAKKIEQL